MKCAGLSTDRAKDTLHVAQEEAAHLGEDPHRRTELLAPCRPVLWREFAAPVRAIIAFCGLFRRIDGSLRLAVGETVTLLHPL